MERIPKLRNKKSTKSSKRPLKNSQNVSSKIKSYIDGKIKFSQRIITKF